MLVRQFHGTATTSGAWSVATQRSPAVDRSTSDRATMTADGVRRYLEFARSKSLAIPMVMQSRVNLLCRNGADSLEEIRDPGLSVMAYSPPGPRRVKRDVFGSKGADVSSSEGSSPVS